VYTTSPCHFDSYVIHHTESLVISSRLSRRSV